MSLQCHGLGPGGVVWACYVERATSGIVGLSELQRRMYLQPGFADFVPRDDARARTDGSSQAESNPTRRSRLPAEEDGSDGT
jgi:hypothetical protein